MKLHKKKWLNSFSLEVYISTDVFSLLLCPWSSFSLMRSFWSLAIQTHLCIAQANIWNELNWNEVNSINNYISTNKYCKKSLIVFNYIYLKKIIQLFWKILKGYNFLLVQQNLITQVNSGRRSKGIPFINCKI